jgi:hypothetical protein
VHALPQEATEEGQDDGDKHAAERPSHEGEIARRQVLVKRRTAALTDVTAVPNGPPES